MILEQLYLGCLAQASYLIGDETTGQAAVVDPRRDIDEYLAKANELGLSIQHVLLTHFHADFASGHLELMQACNATIHIGAGGKADYAFNALADGDTIELGAVKIQALSTPGHTPESMCFLVFDGENAEPHAVLTGDTLFIGDVGRPDLLGSVGLSAEDMAGRLYDSTREKLMTLPPATIVYPGHGAGSLCGKNLSTDTSSTIGEQVASNCALKPMSKDEFVALVTANQPAAPGYFAHDVSFNKKIHPPLDEMAAIANRALTPEQFLDARSDGAQVLDTRPPSAYVAAHVRQSINVGLGGKFATWAGTVLDADRPIVLLCDPGTEEEAIMRLGRIGYDQVIGYLDGGFDALSPTWATEDVITKSYRVTADTLRGHLRDHPDGVLLDVRTPGEVEQGTIEGSVSIPLNQLRSRLGEVPADRHLTIYCGGGYRSAIAMGIIETTGNYDQVDLIGGWTAWQDELANA